MVWSEPHRCNRKTKIPLHPNHVSRKFLRNMGEMCMWIQTLSKNCQEHFAVLGPD